MGAILHLALLDPSFPASNGSFWSWHSPKVSRKILDSLYYDVAVASRPENPASIDPSRIVGGIVRVNADWVGLFRFGDGGRDTHGRPGRYVMAVGLLEHSFLRTTNLKDLISSDVITEILEKARLQCPVPPPKSMEVELPQSMVQYDATAVVRLLETGSMTFDGLAAIDDASKVLSNLPPDEIWTCRIDDGAADHVVVISCYRIPGSNGQVSSLSSSPLTGSYSATGQDVPSVLEAHGGPYREVTYYDGLNVKAFAAIILAGAVVTGLAIWNLYHAKSSGSVSHPATQRHSQPSTQKEPPIKSEKNEVEPPDVTNGGRFDGSTTITGSNEIK